MSCCIQPINQLQFLALYHTQQGSTDMIYTCCSTQNVIISTWHGMAELQCLAHGDADSQTANHHLLTAVC